MGAAAPKRGRAQRHSHARAAAAHEFANEVAPCKLHSTFVKVVGRQTTAWRVSRSVSLRRDGAESRSLESPQLVTQPVVAINPYMRVDQFDIS